MVLAFAMSTDAFAASVGKGMALQKPRITEALRTGLIFGVIEGLTPLIGWFLGSMAADIVADWDHWVAFVLLLVLGGFMIHNGLQDETRQTEPTTRHSFWLLVTTGFATSIDAMAVGVSLAFIDINIWATAAAIGLTTFMMVTLGVMVGRLLGKTIGKRAEVLGGLALIAIGSAILIEHLSV